MCYVYAIKSVKINYIYVGITKNIDERFNRHNIGREKTTKKHKPYRLMFLTTTGDRKTARVVEKCFKSGYGKEFLKDLMRPDGGIGRRARLKIS